MKSHASMNRIYRLVWNHTLGVMVAVAENAKGRGKSRTSRGLVAGAVALTGGLFLTPFAQAGPTGGQVSAGSGIITQVGLNTTINQTSQNLAINWQGFGIAANESVRFNQPNTSSIALNRVVGQDPSQILGSLSANGQVFVINPNGVLFGATAQVNVGGLVATTLNLSDADLLAGRYVFDSSSRSVDGAVVNKGSLTAAQGGYIALLAPEVRNEGVISATLGTALLAAGNKVTLNLNSGSLLGYSIDQGAINALADNKQLIQADGGQVFMSAKAADALSTAVVNNTGILQARTVQNVAGVIKLVGDMDHGMVNVGGTLDASAPTSGNGGFIETSAAHVKVADSAKVTTLAANGLNGTWLIDPVDFTIAATGGDMTGAAVTSALSGGNFTILSSNGTHGGTAGDVNVNDVVNWSANKLTLNAQNNININAAMTATSTASLALEFGQGAVAGGNTSNIITGAAGVVNLPASTTNFTTKQGSDGAVKTYTVITDLGAENSTTTTDLQGMGGNRAGNYVLGANINASATGTWSAGFAPVGYDYFNPFTGTFDGLGHTINNLTINLPYTNNVGLFGNAGTDSVIRNVGLTGGSVTGSWLTGALAGVSYGTVSNIHSNEAVFSNGSDVGGLVGLNNGTVSNSHAEGTVNATGYDVGGLVGRSGGTITNSYVGGGSVSGYQSVGGLVGNGTATNSHYDIDAVSINGATGVISTGGLFNTNGTGQFNEWQTNGSLNIANYASTLSGSGNSYTLSSVQGMKDLIGFADNSAYTFTLANNLTLTSGLYIPYLAGTFDGGNFTISGLNLSGGSKIGLFGTAASGSNIKNVALTGGIVSGGNYVGALVGYNSGTITNSSSTNGAVSSSAGYDVGGLVGRNYYSATITNSYATGSVTESTTVGNAIGGLVGRNYGTVSNSHAAGSVTGNYGVGGLVGLHGGGSINNSYVSSSTVVGSSNVGGLTGVTRGSLSNSHYDIDAVTINGSSAVAQGGLYNTAGTGQFNDWLTHNGTLNIANYASTLSGSGNSYTISNIQGMKDLLGFSDTAAYTFTLASNLDLASTPGFYVPTFAGTFNGAGHTIANLNLNTPTTSNVGLFGTTATGSSILNLGLVANSVSGYSSVGSLVGENNGTVSNSYATGNVVGTGNYIGGLVGFNHGTVSNSYATGSVNLNGGGYRVGGLVGQNSGTVSNSYATGDVNSSYNAGGLSGYNDGTVSYSYATGHVTGNYSGGLIGYNNSNSVSNSFWDVTTSGYADGLGIGYNAASGPGVAGTPEAGVTGLATSAFFNVASFTGFTFGTVGGTANQWVIVDADGSLNNAGGAAGNTRPMLLSEYNTSISNAHQLQLMTLDLTTNYTLVANVDASATNGTVNPSSVWGTAGFTPIGGYWGSTFGTSFSGTLDGQGHTINNLTINQPTSDFVALFRDLDFGGTIKNVGLVGGVVGGRQVVGGLVGLNFGTISNSYNTGSVSASGNTVGGMAGQNNGIISNSYATGAVQGVDYVGGLAGNNDSGCCVGGSGIVNSYATGAVTGSGSHLGGLVGNMQSGTISNSYWDKQTSGQANSAGGIGMTTAEMQTAANFTSATAANGNVNPNWDMAGTWIVYDGHTAPLLRSFMTALTVTASVASKTYDGQAYTASGVTYSAAPNANLLGSLNYSSATNAGTYAASGLYSNQQGYIVSYVGGTLTINKADLVLSGSRAYDATTTVAGSVLTASGVNNETFAVSGAGDVSNLTSKNVQTGSTLASLTGLTLGSSANGGLSSNYNALSTTGSLVTISKADLAVTGLAASSKTYDAGTVATLTGIAAVAALGSDSVTLGGTVSGSFANKTVGTTKAVTVAGNTLSGTDAGNYNLVQQTGLTANISKADLAVTGLAASSKTYDAGTVATLTGIAAVTALGSDSVTLGGTANGTFINKNVGTGKAVTITGNTLTGTDAGNYNLVQQTGITANISKADLAVTGLAASSKTYDTTAIATLTGTAAVTALGSDSVTLGGTASGSFANKNVGTGKAVTVAGNTLSGTDAGNYNLVQQTGLTADISKADLAVTGLAASSKTYDAGTIAALTGTAAVTALGTDSITLGGTASGSFANKTVGTNKAVTVAGNTLSGTDAGNYNLVQQTGLQANISKADLAVTGLAASSKTYDAGTVATLTGSAAVTALGSDSVTLGGTASGTFANKTVGTTKAVTVTGNTLSGMDAGNYNLVQQTGLTADISKADLAVTGLAASSKTYDTTAIATLTGTATVTALTGDSVTLGGTASGSFANKTVGTDIAVTVSGNTLTGTDAGNYNLVQQTGLKASITRPEPIVTGSPVGDKLVAVQVALAQEGRQTDKVDRTVKVDTTVNPDKPQSQQGTLTVVNDGLRLPEGLEPLSAL